MSKKIKNIMIITGLCCILAAIPVFIASASSSLLSPGTSRITEGSSFDFTLDLSDVIEEAGEKEGGALNEFVVALTVTPMISSLSVSEGVGSVNVVSGEYQVASSSLGDHKSLHFTVTPVKGISTDVTYTVSVSISGSVTASDSFTFIVQHIRSEATEKQSGTNNQNTQNTPDANSQSGMTMSGKIKAGGSMPSGGGTGGYSDASTVYAGSWDNYLDSLSVDGFEFTRKFNKIRDTYFVTVPLDTTELKVNAKASDSSATVAVTGNKDLPEGRSKIMVSVTADDGSIRIYRIYVDRTDEKEEEAEPEDKGKSGMPELPEGFTPPDGAELQDGFTPPDGMEMPEGMTPPGGAGKKDKSKANNMEGSDEG